jgi:hypothetical protein
MNNMVSHLDITALCCAVDDICQSFDKYAADQIMLLSMLGEEKESVKNESEGSDDHRHCLLWLRI